MCDKDRTSIAIAAIVIVHFKPPPPRKPGHKPKSQTPGPLLLTVYHESNFDIRIRQATDVHFFQILCLQNDHSELARRGHIAQTETNIAQLLLLNSIRFVSFRVPFGFGECERGLFKTRLECE